MYEAGKWLGKLPMKLVTVVILAGKRKVADYRSLTLHCLLTPLVSAKYPGCGLTLSNIMSALLTIFLMKPMNKFY